jgi:hypothetical protein
MVNKLDLKPQWGYPGRVRICKLQTIVETPEFTKQIQRYLTDESAKTLIDYISANPLEGDLIKGSGGARKIRWAKPGSGKRAGLRVIYYYHNEQMPIFLFMVYGKNECTNLSRAACNALKTAIAQIILTYMECLYE